MPMIAITAAQEDTLLKRSGSSALRLVLQMRPAHVEPLKVILGRLQFHPASVSLDMVPRDLWIRHCSPALFNAFIRLLNRCLHRLKFLPLAGGQAVPFGLCPRFLRLGL